MSSYRQNFCRHPVFPSATCIAYEGFSYRDHDCPPLEGAQGEVRKLIGPPPAPPPEGDKIDVRGMIDGRFYKGNGP